MASKVSCIHSIKFAAQLQKWFARRTSEYFQENKPILLHLVGLETEESTSTEKSSSPASSSQQQPTSAAAATAVAGATTTADGAAAVVAAAEDTTPRIAVSTMSMEETCRIFAFIIHSLQAPWPLPTSTE